MKKLILLLQFLFIINLLSAQEIPIEAINIPDTAQITWVWYQVDSATGYKINTVNNYSTATNIGSDTSTIQTGLTPNTLYTRYLWAYNTCSYSSVGVLTETTLDNFICGNSIVVTHTVGLVAPVTKTTTYNTVTNVAGETDKCWITSNLGSDNQATTKSDATEASAGWYWQFNHMQGYKNDGTPTIPTWTITNINENSDWLSINDPCAIELGTGWRIPTYAEWTNIDVAGNWTNWNDSWNSVLKMHAAGSLFLTNGLPFTRGSIGSYWSSTQDNNSLGISIYFNSDYSDMYSYAKAVAMPLRCIRDINTVIVDSLSAPTEGTHTTTATQITWRWNSVSGATGYKWNTVNDYSTATNMLTAILKTETGLVCNTSYNRYVWAYNDTINSISTLLNESTLPNLPIEPIEATHISSPIQIIWNWNTSVGAIGYKWNTVNNYTSAIDLGASISKIETGLTPNSSYTCYIWSYNNCGNSNSVILTQSTTSSEDGFVCGDSLTITHIVGIVNPISKTVTYGTVKSILGETSKCWITSNLGSTHSASSVTDTNEDVSGWYWRFNNKQGYRNVNKVTTPIINWNTTINESSNWLSENDPCTIELGAGWRIPTAAEWTNVDVTGQWNNYTKPYDSSLKLNTAGRLLNTTGKLYSRGVTGYYWSSTQNNNTYARMFYISSSYSYIINYLKTNGACIRCIHD